MGERDIVILMSTHNGADYLADQLHSLCAQTLADRIHVSIRDDGSSDATVALIHTLDLAPLSVEITSGPNLGVRDSFSTLICEVPDSFRTVMLCDQDDVWLPDKVAVAVQALEQAGDGPTLYCGRSTVADADLTPRGITVDAPGGPTLHHALFQNISPGHTMAFNQALVRLYRSTFDADVYMHDWWLYLLAVSVGKVIFDRTPHCLYRIHSDNEIGYAANAVQQLMADVKLFFRVDRSLMSRQAIVLDQAVGAQLTPHDRTLLTAFLNQRSFITRWQYLRRYPMISRPGRPAITSTVLFFLGVYNAR